jgi:methylated-DNA-[protein]-cysteine S-methyltransferase
LARAALDTPIGRLDLFATDLGLARIVFDEDDGDRLAARTAELLGAGLVDRPRRLDPVKRQLEEYFDGRRRVFDLSLDFGLISGFALRVAKQVAGLPFGRPASYGAVAEMMGAPRAARAVGQACGVNPAPVVVPCHRVIRSDGSLGGYAGREDVKRALLEFEGVRLR